MSITVALLIDQFVQTMLSILPVSFLFLSKKLSFKWKVFLLVLAVFISNLLDADHIRIVQNGIKAIYLTFGGRTPMHSILGALVVSFTIFIVMLWQLYVFNVIAKEKWITIYHVFLTSWVTFSALSMHLIWDARGKYGAMIFYPIQEKYILSSENWIVLSGGIIAISILLIGLEYILSTKR